MTLERISEYISPSFASKGPKSHWFGYYNYSPMSADGTKLLAQEVDFDGRDILPEDTADIGWYDLKDGSWHKVTITHAINWQQGAMLQWLGPDFNSRIIFNDVDGEHFCSRIYNIETGEMKTIPFPVYGVSPDGKFSITLQFERCAWCRAYHYESIRNPKWNVPVAEEDGIFRVDLETGRSSVSSRFGTLYQGLSQMKATVPSLIGSSISCLIRQVIGSHFIIGTVMVMNSIRSHIRRM